MVMFAGLVVTGCFAMVGVINAIDAWKNR